MHSRVDMTGRGITKNDMMNDEAKGNEVTARSKQILKEEECQHLNDSCKSGFTSPVISL